MVMYAKGKGGHVDYDLQEFWNRHAYLCEFEFAIRKMISVFYETHTILKIAKLPEGGT